MSHFTIYHNPRCSKSREALKILQNHNIEPVIIEYLKNPLPISTLEELSSQFDLKDFVRCNEQTFKDLKLNLDNQKDVLKAMATSPILMQRPIVTYAKQAVVGRPVENITKFIQEQSS